MPHASCLEVLGGILSVRMSVPAMCAQPLYCGAVLSDVNDYAALLYGGHSFLFCFLIRGLMFLRLI